MADPTRWEKLRRWFHAKDEEKQPASREVADEINAALPEELSAREAVLKKRKRLKQLDEETRE